MTDGAFFRKLYRIDDAQDDWSEIVGDVPRAKSSDASSHTRQQQEYLQGVFRCSLIVQALRDTRG